MRKCALFLLALLSLAACVGENELPSSETADLTKAAEDAEKLAIQTANPDVLVDVLSNAAQQQLSSMKSTLKSLTNTQNNLLTAPGGASESDTTTLTQAKSMIKEASAALDNINIQTLPAMDSKAEKAIATLLANLKKYNEEASAIKAPTLAKIPAEVTDSLMMANQGLVDFQNKPVPRKRQPIPRGETGTTALRSLLAYDEIPKF